MNEFINQMVPLWVCYLWALSAILFNDFIRWVIK